MYVFKFGGASVKDAAAVRNVSHILSLFPDETLVVVISAMGKSTNVFEEISTAFVAKNEEQFLALTAERYEFHLRIMQDLFADSQSPIFQRVATVFSDLKARFYQPNSTNAHFEYDQIVSLGEVVSTMIVEAFSLQEGHVTSWIDARKLIRTNNVFKEGEIDWANTEALIQEHLLPVFQHKRIVITQGFIGHTSEGFTTTLGREGSDYTAGIIAYCTNASGVFIWKDVPGMLNADPKWFDDTIKLDKISFKEAIELSYYGASVIHPKTIKPLQNKGIPLYVKSFIEPNEPGTTIQESNDFDHLVPSFIFKLDQVLMSFTPKDFSFIVEENLGAIFQQLAAFGVKINLMQNSALSFSILFDRAKTDPKELLNVFNKQYSVKYNEHVELVTIRHYDTATINRVSKNKTVLLEQRTRHTIRMVMKSEPEQ